MADQEFLASFGVEIDESGLDRLQKALKENRTLAEQLASAFDSARNAVAEFFNQLSASTLPSGELSPWQRLAKLSEGGLVLRPRMDTSQAEDTLLRFRDFLASMEFPLNADASGILAAGQEALAELQYMFSSARLFVNAQVIPRGGTGLIGGGLPGPVTRASTGGRFSGPTVTEIAEDGDPEYVIPVKKESIAVPLLRQLMGELSSSAREALRGDALAGLPDLLSSAPAAAAPVIQQTSNSSVQAPVSINVTAAGTDPEAVGRSIYDVAERYLLRTLQSI